METLTKQCSICGRVKDLLLFYQDKRSRDTFQSECKSCHKKFKEESRRNNPERYKEQKNRDRNRSRLAHPGQHAAEEVRRAARARVFIAEMKGNTCTKCLGEFENTAKLHFHHRNPADKAFNVSKGVHLSRIKIQAEIEKCVVVCLDCHLDIHHPSY